MLGARCESTAYGQNQSFRRLWIQFYSNRTSTQEYFSASSSASLGQMFPCFNEGGMNFNKSNRLFAPLSCFTSYTAAVERRSTR